MRSAPRGRSVSGAALLLGLLGAGCLDTVPTEPRGTRDQLESALTPAALAALDAEGRFVFPTPVADGEPMITEERAKALALAFFKTWGHVRSSSWMASSRPEGIDADLEPCGRAFFMESAYEQPLDPVLPEHFRRVFGPKWIVRLCHRGAQQLAIAVPVRDIGAEITAAGRIGTAGDYYFCYRGVADGVLIPPSPEEGAVAVSRALRARIAGVPVLRRIRGDGCQADFGSVWHYDVEDPVEIVGRESAFPREVSGAGYAFPTVMWSTYEIPRWWTYNVVVVPNPWYSGASLTEPFSFYDPAISGGRPATLKRRPDVAYHSEEVEARRR